MAAPVAAPPALVDFAYAERPGTSLQDNAGAPVVQVAVVGSAAASSSTQSSELSQIATNVCAIATTSQDVKRELGIVCDAVSGATVKLETHGKTLEAIGSIVNGLTTSVDKLTNIVTSHLAKGAAGKGSSQEHLDATLASVMADAADRGSSQGAPKVRRVGSAADAKQEVPQPDDADFEAADANGRIVGMHHMIAIRRSLNDRLTESIGAALTCAGVYHDSETFSDLVLESTEKHFSCSSGEARTFLSSTIKQPTKQRGGALHARSSSSSSDNANGLRQKKAEPTLVRADILLYAVQPHLVEALKKKVIAAFFAAVGLEIRTVTLIQVLQWLVHNKYTRSEMGRKAVRAGVKAMYAYLGVTDRERDDDVGSGTVLGISIGHYALASCFIRHCLELAVAKAYNKRTRRTGAEPGLYLHWRLELRRVHKFLEHDNEAHFGIALVDGDAEDRITLNTSENEMVEHLHSKQDDNERSFIRLLERLLAEQERTRTLPGGSPAC